MDKEPIITRFAPSPTGELHIGSARTALFEYLAAKSTGGKFYLRIEDTDRNRYVEGAEERLLEALKWLKLTPDNVDDIVVQSERLDLYKKHALELVKSDKAYICTCSKVKLEADKVELEKSGKLPRYIGTCREKNIQIDDIVGDYVIRLKMPEKGDVIVHDLVRGDVKFDLSLFDDQILLKSDGFPTYHLASVIDDHETGITDVLRAEEWLSSTPKHLVLYEAFGWAPPKFGHFSMILAPDHSKLSKRHGATSVEEFKSLGYLPEAIINFIALLGWNPKDEREFFTLNELISEFKLANLNKAPAIFNIDKLNNINAHYITEETKNQRPKIKNNIKNFDISDITDAELDLVGRGGYKTLREAAEYILKLRQDPEYEASILIFKKSDQATTLKALQIVQSKLPTIEQWNNEAIQQLLESVVSENTLTNGDVFWPVRVALSGEEKSPSPVELALALGKEETLERIERAISKLSSAYTRAS